MKWILFKITLLPFLLFSFDADALANPPLLKPFILASQSPGKYEKRLSEVEQALIRHDFEIAGEYTPYTGTTIIVVTNDAMKAVAEKSTYGGFGAMQRVSVVAINGEIQVSYTNPVYISHVYQMKGVQRETAEQMEKALGNIRTFGSDEGLEAEDLRDYQYKIFMPYFDDILELAEYPNFREAMLALERGLTQNLGGVSKVYQIDLPNKEVSIFGVAMTREESSDKFIMSEIDFRPLRSAAHLPYEILVTGGKIIALSAKFRIAINFPDLALIGSHSLWNIMDAPDDIEEALSAVAGEESD